MTLDGLPTASVALTTNVFNPSVDVSMGLRLAAVPVAVHCPEPASAQLYAAFTTWPN